MSLFLQKIGCCFHIFTFQDFQKCRLKRSFTLHLFSAVALHLSSLQLCRNVLFMLLFNISYIPQTVGALFDCFHSNVPELPVRFLPWPWFRLRVWFWLGTLCFLHFLFGSNIQASIWINSSVVFCRCCHLISQLFRLSWQQLFISRWLSLGLSAPR